MRQRHGIPDAVKVSVTSTDTQSVSVTDGERQVILALGTASNPAGMTPEQARFIAGCLIASAGRVELAPPPPIEPPAPAIDMLAYTAGAPAKVNPTDTADKK